MNDLDTIFMRSLRSRMIHPSRMLFLIMLLLIACVPVEQSPPVDLALGQTVYEANCASCHGMQGEGQPNWRQPGQDGKLPAPPHDSTGHTWHHPDQMLLQMIAQRSGVPNSPMPAYEGELTQEEMEATLAYIKTFWDKRPRDFQEQITDQYEAHQ